MVDSIYGSNDTLELVWKNGQILVQGGSSSRTSKTPSSIGYSINSPRGKEANDEDGCMAKRARLNTLYSAQDPYHQSNINDQDSCHLDLQFSKSKSSIKLKDGYANLRPVKESKITAHYLPSANSLKKPRMDSSPTPATNSQKQEMRCDQIQITGNVNFSNFLRPAPFIKSTNYYEGNSATLPTNQVEKAATTAATSSKAPNHYVVNDSAKGSHRLTEFHQDQQTDSISYESNPVPFVARSQKTLPDEHSEAAGQCYNQSSSSAGLRAKGKTDTNSCNEPLLASCSVCSTKHEDTDDSTCLSDNDEEPEDVVKETPAQEGTRVKRSRNAKIHNLYERKRRDKINKKMRVLKELIPNCNKMDRASTLDDAIQYLKTLKLQLQILSMGTGPCMPVMMLPQLMGTGMAFRPAGTGIPCSLPPFPIPLPMPATAITNNRLIQMFGFPNNQVQAPLPPMPSPHAPFIPMVGINPSTQPVVLSTSTATNPAEHLASAQIATQKVSIPKNSGLNGQSKCATN